MGPVLVSGENSVVQVGKLKGWRKEQARIDSTSSVSNKLSKLLRKELCNGKRKRVISSTDSTPFVF